ncbi:MAG TPA: M20 family metallopeptidase [Clostridiales bacterium]|nr:M20 family metallopeptidase [Clostridiales bacterium]
MAIHDEVKKIADDIYAKLIDIRRGIHKFPELGLKTYRTAELITGHLTGLGVEVTKAADGSGVVGLIRGKAGSKTVALRADIDALPVNEENSFEYRSCISGAMHACGHDFHTACLLGASEILYRLKDKINGNIKLLFQPGEEGLDGALAMIEEDVLENPHVNACIAAHVWPYVPVGKIAVIYGPSFSAINNFIITITGKGGHGAMPHDTVDPIIAGCNIINALQTIKSRRIDSFEPATVSICSFNAGTSVNIIPDTAVIGGTLRTFNLDLRKKIETMICEISKGIAEPMGAKVSVQFMNEAPPVMNDREITELFINSASKIAGKENIITDIRPAMVSEDFAFFSEKVPSTYFWLGCRNEEKGMIHPLHSSNFQGDEECIKIGAAAFAQFAIDYLAI